MTANYPYRIHCFLLLVTFIALVLNVHAIGSDDMPEKGSIQITYTAQAGNVCTLVGSISDRENKKPIVGAMIEVFQNEKRMVAAQTNADGKFEIKQLALGTYKIRLSATEFDYLEQVLKLKKSYLVDMKICLARYRIEYEKPILYLYPTQATDIQVKLNYKGVLTHSYPKYGQAGWQVKAQPNGTLHDANGMEYYALFWEGIPDRPLVPQNGFLVAGADCEKFLEEKLAYLGLNRREANEFILYWLPRLQNNPYNLIHFSDTAYQNQAELLITPKPQTCIRVMMLYCALDTKISFPLQDLESLKKERNGYTVVEWGGCEIQNTFSENP